jgi:hypothetical protein
MNNHTLNWLGIYALVFSTVGILTYLFKDMPISKKMKPYKEESCCHCSKQKEKKVIVRPVVVAHR